MPTGGPNYSAAIDDYGGGSGSPWTNLANAKANDGSYATCAITSSDAQSTRADSSDYGFSLPAAAVLVGFLVTIRGFNDFGGAYTSTPQCTLGLGGSNSTLGVVNSEFTTSPSNTTVGGATDLWGLTGKTAADVNSSAFAIQHYFVNFSGHTVNFSWDYSSITVYYTVPASSQFMMFFNKIREWFGWRPKPLSQTREAEPISLCPRPMHPTPA